jgi:hypothetical protein
VLEGGNKGARDDQRKKKFEEFLKFLETAVYGNC